MRPACLLLAVLLLAPSCGGSGGEPSPPSGSVPEPGTAETWLLVELLDEDDLDELVEETGAMVLGRVEGTPYWRVSLPEGMTLAEFQEELEGDGRVVNADVDVALSFPEGDGSTLPAGGLLLGSFVPIQNELVRIGAVAARTRATGLGVRVAVLDSGVVEHDLLAGHLEPDGWDFVEEDADPTDRPNGRDDDQDGEVDEGYGHGTFVASLVLAVAPDARIVPFRVLDSDGVGRASTLAAAISLAAERGADVINLSAGMPDRVKVIQDAIQTARSLGVAVVASAGNDGTDSVNFPSALSGAFSVAAVDEADLLAPFSSFGGEVDLSAPGVELLGAFPYDVFETGTARWSGTSFSAALVSGGFALLRELDPVEDGESLLQRLAETSIDVRDLNETIGSRMGEGRLDLDAATAP